VPREHFVRGGDEEAAYLNMPLPIGYGQTISQPYIVALMTDLLDLKGDERVLEVGTGSGYQAAILSALAREVYSIEVVEPLAAAAAAKLARLGYRNVEVRAGDGAKGWPEKAPFDAIVVTAAAGEGIPPDLVAQLRPGGRMVVPVGQGRWAQNLLLVTKDEAGRVTEKTVLPVAFVPLV
jgi:protein-L-isoaspartate(D-aspartate) O-methyltransferase